MYIVLGATGHVGAAVAYTLLSRGERVTAVVRDPARADALAKRGATIATMDIRDTDALRAVFRTGRRAFLLNPPGDTSGDSDASEDATADAIVRALAGSDLEFVVGGSTYGAQDCQRCGDLGTLWRFERALAAQPVPSAINRGAYYFTNWDPQLETVRRTGALATPLPTDCRLPMVSPADVGRSAADLVMTGAAGDMRHVEGPRRYTPSDVAAAFADALDRPVHVETVPRDDWQGMFENLGFSKVAARSYTRMTEISVDAGFASPAEPVRGSVTLEDHVASLVARDA